MKGVVLAGGMGTRLSPLTDGLNKHLLPVYDQPMIYYPINALVEAGITDILVITGGNHANQFVDFLGDGSAHSCNITYRYQCRPGGIAEALALAEEFVGNQHVCVILGDNIFEAPLKPYIDAFLAAPHGRHTGDFNSKCHVVCKQVEDPQNYGVLTVTDKAYIEEKPTNPKSKLAVTGIYFYTWNVFKKIKTLKRSDRGELEVTDLNNLYADIDALTFSITTDKWWDCGVDIDHMLQVANEIKQMKGK